MVRYYFWINTDELFMHTTCFLFTRGHACGLSHALSSRVHLSLTKTFLSGWTLLLEECGWKDTTSHADLGVLLGTQGAQHRALQAAALHLLCTG